MSIALRPLHWFHQLHQAGFDLLFPPACVSCGRPGYALCPACAQTVEPVGDVICANCGRRQPQRTAQCADCQQKTEFPIRLVRAATMHGGPVREGIHHLKYSNGTAIAPLLARYLVAAFFQPPWPQLRGRIDAVTPVPLHGERLRERGYNQAELLARAFCRQVRLPLRPRWLQRQRLTQSQVGLRVQERQENVADAFRAHPAVRGKSLLLIDDVYTTGATLNACATAALAAGATNVFALALAIPYHTTGDAPVDV